MAKPELNAILSERIELTSDLFIFRVTPKEWSLPSFIAGQFAVLGLPGSSPRCAGAEPDAKPVEPEKFIQRAYSIASSPQEKSSMEFYIALVKSGVLTPRLCHLKKGDPLYLSSKISGAFTLTGVPDKSHVVLIATGTGIAPFVSMLKTYLKKGGRRYALFHGVRESIDLGYRSEMEALQKQFSEFSYHPIISRPDQAKTKWMGPTGHVQELWKMGVLKKQWGGSPTPQNTHVFLCGSPMMIESTIELLGHEGFKENKKTDPGQIHVERYW